MTKRGLQNMPTGGGGGDWIKTIRLIDDGESCKIRFLTDKDDIFFEWQHRKMEGGQFRGWQVCPQSAFETPCDECASGDDKKRAQLQFFAWVWEYTHDFTVDKEGRKPVKLGRKTLYREDVNEVRLMRYAGTHKAALEFRADRFSTLIDRDYDWVRSGEKGSMKPQYILEPSDEGKAPLSKELVAIAADLPDLEDIAFSRIDSLTKKEDVPYDQEDNKETPESTDAPPF